MNIGGADRAPREPDPDRPRADLRPVPRPGSGSEAAPPRPSAGPPKWDPASLFTPSGTPASTPTAPGSSGAPPAAPPPGPARPPAAGAAASPVPLTPDVVEAVPPPPPPRRLAVVRGGARVPVAAIWRKLEERRAAIGSNPRRVSKSLMVASGLLVLLFLIAIFVMPRPRHREIAIDLPAPSRTIVPEPLPEPPPVAERPTAPVMVPQVLSRASEEKLEPAPLMRRRAVDPDAGQSGRERARQATRDLAAATGALDRALGDLSASLGATRGEVVPTRRRRRDVGSGRSDRDLAGLESGRRGTMAADVGGSAVQGRMVALGTLAAPGEPSSDGPGSSAGAAPGVYRSNASLLAVIQKYAPGIQYCYENELKRDPGRRGKLVVAISVAANGSVTEATVVQNTVGSDRLASCALGQIREWRFPAIAGGVTSFQAPFLFTPPD